MRAFEVRLNGRKLCVGGIGEDGVLDVSVASVVGNRGDDLFLQFGGLISRTEQHISWIRQKSLRVGDTIQVRIVDANTTNKPVIKYRTDPKKKLINERRYVRMMAKKLGWTIQTRPKTKKAR
jgi:hypothetical protein